MLTRRSVRPPASEESLSPEEQVRWDLIVAGIAALVIIIDQISKALVVNHFHTCSDTSLPSQIVPVIGNYLDIQYLCNNGTAFSLFQNSNLVYFLILVAVGVIAWLYWTSRPRRNSWLRITFGMIIGGALGNLIDRAVRHGQVVDFIHFQIPQLNFNFAVFNLADSAVVVGMISLVAIFWLLPRESESEPDEPKMDAKAPPEELPPTAEAESDSSASHDTPEVNNNTPAANDSVPAEDGIASATNGSVPAEDGAGATPVPSPAVISAPARAPASATPAPARTRAGVSVQRSQIVSRASKYPVSTKSKRKKR